MNELLKQFKLNLRMFGDTIMTTDSSEMSAEMKTFYSGYLIDNAKPALVHDQFGQKRPIPKGQGKTVEFRRFHPLPKALKPLEEGVTPKGNKLRVSALTSTVKQYGDFIRTSDVLLLTAIDPLVTEMTELLGRQAGRTLDSVTREAINAGTNVQFGDGKVSARHLLVGGKASGNHTFNIEALRFAERTLKINHAPKIGGKHYVAIVHPDVAYDIKKDKEFEEWHKYTNADVMYEGEIGKILGTRFVENAEAKVFYAPDLSEKGRTITMVSASGKTFTLAGGTLTAKDQTNLVGRSILCKGVVYTVASATATTIVVNENIQGSPSASDKIYPGEAGAEGRSVYSTLIIGQDAYGVTEVTGGGLEFIHKPLGAGDDPLNQRSTVGWKALKTAEILVNEYMVRIETASSFDLGMEN